MYDVIIVGGGPAGLSAAVVLGRCRRRVLVCDTGKPRNATSHGMHCYLTRDGIVPGEFLRLGREELDRYGVECRAEEVRDAGAQEGGFFVALAGGERLRSKMLLVATGVCDHIPAIEGIEALYGRSVFHCPYCDGWEMRDQPLAVYGRGHRGAALACSLRNWSRDLVLCSDGPARLPAEDAGRLKRQRIPVRAEKIARLEGTDGVLERIVFQQGEPLARRALFFSTGQRQHSSLPERLGCKFNLKGTVRTTLSAATNVPGLYVAGDASHDVQFVVVAAAEGAKAGVAIHEAPAKKEL
jgi:thioredoxin reductase